MVVVKLMGGLGNQMFQYAAGRRLSHFNGTSLKFDLSWFQENNPECSARNFSLKALNISGEIATAKEVKKYKNKDLFVWPNFIYNIFKLSRRMYVSEKEFSFDPQVLELSGNIYLDGYWQSEKYFKDIDSIIRDDFSVKDGLNVKDKESADAITKTNSVSIHIRRGDYLSNAATNQYHGACTLDYYRRAVEKISSQIPQPHFFVFSDDHKWTKENLKVDFPLAFIEHNGPDKAYNDLRLMTLCKHNIIANSSLSWWGAWLNKNPEKVIISPLKWFNVASINTEDLIPESWLKI